MKPAAHLLLRSALKGEVVELDGMDVGVSEQRAVMRTCIIGSSASACVSCTYLIDGDVSLIEVEGDMLLLREREPGGVL